MILFDLCCFLQDYKGQKLAEQIFQGIILVSAVRHHLCILRNTPCTRTQSFTSCMTPGSSARGSAQGFFQGKGIPLVAPCLFVGVL